MKLRASLSVFHYTPIDYILCKKRPCNNFNWVFQAPAEARRFWWCFRRVQSGFWHFLRGGGNYLATQRCVRQRFGTHVTRLMTYRRASNTALFWFDEKIQPEKIRRTSVHAGLANNSSCTSTVSVRGLDCDGRWLSYLKSASNWITRLNP